MKGFNRLLPTLGFGAVLALGVWLMWPDHRPMPQVRFTLTDGRVLGTAELRGTKLLVNFWSVSCEVCLREMPHLTTLHDSLQDRGFSVIGVAMPFDPPPAIMATVQRLEPGYPIALDVHGELSKAFGDVRITPTSFLVDREGNIRYSKQGALDMSRIRATLSTF